MKLKLKLDSVLWGSLLCILCLLMGVLFTL